MAEILKFTVHKGVIFSRPANIYINNNFSQETGNSAQIKMTEIAIIVCLNFF